MGYVIIAHQSDPVDQSEELDSMNGLRNPDVLYFGSEGKEMESLDDVQEVLDEYCIEEDGRSYEVLEYKQIHESRSKPFGNPKLWEETVNKLRSVDGRSSVPQTNLNEAWSQAYELLADYEDLNDEDIIACREVMHERVKVIMAMLHDFVPEDMSKYEAS